MKKNNIAFWIVTNMFVAQHNAMLMFFIEHQLTKHLIWVNN